MDIYFGGDIMNLIVLLPILAALLGVFGGVFRGLSLLNGYEPQTHLPIAGDNFQLMLIILSVISVVIFVILCEKFKFDAEPQFEKAFISDSAGYKTLCVLSALITILCGAGGFYFALTNSDKSFYSHITEFPLWILAVLTGVAIIGLIRAKENITESSAYFTLIPMFWAAFDLIVIFKNNSSSPFVGHYSFELIPSVFLTLAFYAFASFLYSKPKPRFMLFASSLAIVFSLVCVIGTVMAHILNPSLWAFNMQTLMRTGCLLGTALYLFALDLNLCKSV